MAVSSTFESSLRRGNPTTTSTSRRTTPPSSTSASSNSSRRVAAAPPLRSRSVSAFSRTSNSDFSIKRDNPLFDNNGNGNDDDAGFPSSGLGSDRFTSKTKAKATATDGCNDKRGRSVSGFDSDGKHGLGSWNSKGLSRSLSVVDTKRRGRSVSRNPPLSRAQFATSESEGEQEGNSWTKSKNKCNLIATSGDGGNLVRSRSSLTRSGQLNRMEPSDFHTSLSFEGDNLVGDASASSNIYRTVKSEVRCTISDIQNDLQGAIRRSNPTTDVDVVEFQSDIQQEYATKLEQVIFFCAIIFSLRFKYVLPLYATKTDTCLGWKGCKSTLLKALMRVSDMSMHMTLVYGYLEGADSRIYI